MAYGEASANQIGPASLLADSSRTIERLSEIRDRVAKLGDALHGSQPREAAGLGKQMGAPEMQPTVRRNLDRIHGLVCDVDGELQRIEARL